MSGDANDCIQCRGDGKTVNVDWQVDAVEETKVCKDCGIEWINKYRLYDQTGPNQ